MLQSCLRIRYLFIAFSRFEKRVFIYRGAFVQCLFPKRVIKTRFAILNKVSFTVSSNLVCIAILFKIVKLIFPHKLRLCNAICVEYRVVYRVVVSYILRVLWKRGMIIVFSNAPRFLNRVFNISESRFEGYPVRRHDCTSSQVIQVTLIFSVTSVFDNASNFKNLCGFSYGIQYVFR